MSASSETMVPSVNSPTWTRVTILFVSFSLLTVITVLCGSIINSDGFKYSTVRQSKAIEYLQNHGLTSYDPHLVHAGTTGGLNGNSVGCVVALNVPNSLLCCDEMTRNYEWICGAAFDPMNKIFTKSIVRAILFPLLPVIFSGVGDIMVSQSLSHQKPEVVKSMLRRLSVYLGIIAFRTCVLYLMPLLLFSSANQGNEDSQCWCPDLVSTTKCRMEFDFSDHVVLAIVQFITPCLLEMGHIFSIWSVSNRSHILQIIGFVIAFGVIMIQVRSLFLTSLYFHTPAENIVGLCIAGLLVLLPICLLSTVFATSKAGIWFRKLII